MIQSSNRLYSVLASLKRLETQVNQTLHQQGLNAEGDAAEKARREAAALKVDLDQAVTDTVRTIRTSSLDLEA